MRISDWSSDVCSSDLFIRRSLECCGRGFELVLTIRQPETRSLARQGFNPADPTGHCGFADDLEKAYVAECRDVRAAAQFNGIMLIRGLAHGKHANFIAVFFPEQSHRARSNGVIRGHRSEEHTSELQSLMRISYAVFCLKKKTKNKTNDS